MAAEGASQLVSVVTLLGAAIIAVPIFKRLGLGSVLGYLAAGLAIGPFGLKLFSDPQAIIHVAELGVVMFLFIIGLEMKPSHLWGLRRQIFGLGSMQVVVCAVLLTFVGMAFGYSWKISFVGGAGFVLTSTAIVMQVLSERGDIASPRGQRMVSILLFESDYCASTSHCHLSCTDRSKSYCRSPTYLAENRYRRVICDRIGGGRYLGTQPDFPYSSKNQNP